MIDCDANSYSTPFYMSIQVTFFFLCRRIVLGKPVTMLSSSVEPSCWFPTTESSVEGGLTGSKTSKKKIKLPASIAISGMTCFVVSALVAFTYIMRRQLHKCGIMIPYQLDKNDNITNMIMCIFKTVET